MRDVLKLTIAPVASLIIIMLGISYFNTFVSVRLTTDGFPSILTGITYASYYTGMMLGAVYNERIIHKKGHIRSFSIFAATASTFILIQSLTPPPYFWILFRFITGAAVSGLFIVIESWLLLLAAPKTRGAVLSIYMVALYSAQSIGQFGISVVPMGSDLAFIISVIFATASIIPVCLMKAAAPTLSESEYINVFYLLKKVPLGFFGNLVAGLILGAFYAIGPVYAQRTGLSVLEISLFMSVTILGGMALQWPIGKLSDIFQRRHIIILICLLFSALSIALIVTTHFNFNIKLLLLFFFGGATFTLYPISITYSCDYFSSAGITSVSSAALIIYGFGCILGPLISPIFMQVIGPSGLFYYTAILGGILIFFALYRQHTTPNQPEASKEPYQINPGTTGKFPEE